MDRPISIPIWFLLFTLFLLPTHLPFAATIDTANAITIQPGSIHNGQISSKKEKDYFRIQLTKQATYVFYTYGGSSKTKGALYDQQYKYTSRDQEYPIQGARLFADSGVAKT